MDKETLSNYGWIVIAVLVLVVMIALATPFGSYISEAIQSTTKGLFDVNKNALDAAGVPGLTVQDQEFDVPDMNHGAETPVQVGSATFSDGVTLTWAELQLEENGTKYGYDASAISDTSIGYNAFNFCETIINITLPDSVTTIDCCFFSSSITNITLSQNMATIPASTFMSCDLENITFSNSITNIESCAFESCGSFTITFEGTMEQWNAVNLYTDSSKVGDWNAWCGEITVTCTDGTITVPAWTM